MQRQSWQPCNHNWVFIAGNVQKNKCVNCGEWQKKPEDVVEDLATQLLELKEEFEELKRKYDAHQHEHQCCSCDYPNHMTRKPW